MLNIRKEQMVLFGQEALRRSEQEMLAHSKEFSPTLCNTLTDDQLRIAVGQAMRRAGGYGFTNRGPIRLYIELSILFGSDFDADPQCFAFAKFLNAGGDQM